VSSPSYLVLRDEEAKITYAPTSPLSNPNHPLRESIAVPAKAKSAVEEEEV